MTDAGSNATLAQQQPSISSSSEVKADSAEGQFDANEQLCLAASRGDIATIKALLTDESSGVQPWYESPHCLNWSAVHFAAENGHTECVSYLLRNGALWNAVDINGTTAAEVAWSNNWDKTYAALLEEGVRQNLVLAVLQGQETAEEQGEDDDDDDDDDDGMAVDAAAGAQDPAGSGGSAAVGTDGTHMTLSAPTGELANSNLAFLSSRLRFFTDEKGKERCLDEDDNMVMAGWETEIMRCTAKSLCESHENGDTGLRILNIGYGLGIVDDFFQSYQPSRHVIVEPHPDAIAYFTSKPISESPTVELVPKRWEDALSDGDLGEFDVIYADPYAQGYEELKKLFDLVPNFLSGPEARFSFFHGLAGTNRFFYDVYTRVAELDLREVGLETEWETIPVELEDREEVWRGIKREYWTSDHFRLPICNMGLF